MNTKKLIVFLLFAFVPMIIVGLVMHFGGASAVEAAADATNGVTPINDLLYGAAGLAGMIVLLAVNICLFLYDRYISKEKIFSALL